MRYIFVDLETNDKAKTLNASPKQVSNWPRILQIAWMVSDDPGDSPGGLPMGNIVKECSYMIAPTDFEIAPGALAVHGITRERALAEGIPIMDALNSFRDDIETVDALVAHNVQFDAKTIMAEYIRQTTHWLQPLFKLDKICTMMKSTKHCNLPGKYGGPKWPKLGELYQKLFGEEPTESHDAMADVHTCAECFFELKRLGVIE